MKNRSVSDYGYVNIDGHRLHRIVVHPPAGIEERAACIFSHGQGDYSERYADVLAPFSERGIRCIATDLQGHGRSPGRRGQVGKLSLVDRVIESNLAACDGLATGIAGHSMGGLLTLRHLLRALDGELEEPKFCWVNAPLLDPADGRSRWFVEGARLLAQIAPNLTINTGVSPEMCRSNAEGEPSPTESELGHQRISLGWGVGLLEMAASVTGRLPTKTLIHPFLLTQGSADQVCPAKYAAALYDKLDWPNKQYTSFTGMRHETFEEANKQELFDTVAEWLDGFVGEI